MDPFVAILPRDRDSPAEEPPSEALRTRRRWHATSGAGSQPETTSEAPGRDLLEGLARSLDLGVVLCDAEDRVLSANRVIDELFPGGFTRGDAFRPALERLTSASSVGFPHLPGQADAIGAGVLRGGTPRQRVLPGGQIQRFSYLRAAAGGEGALCTAHCLLAVEPEVRFFETYRAELDQLSRMREIIDLLYESIGGGEVLTLILVAVTAGQGFGFNRAFFLEAAGTRLRGRLGIGPANAEEAHRIWSRLGETETTLRETHALLEHAGGPPDPATQDLVQQIELPLAIEEAGARGILAACRDRRPALVTASSELLAAERELFATLGSSDLAVVPLHVGDRLAGVILADNFITGKAIARGDLNLLRTFSTYAAIALERSYLYEALTRNVEELRAANRTLQTHQRRLLEAEKLSALGKMAACVSHEIRNPLVAIGGLTRSVLAEESLAEDSRKALELVAGEVTRLERFLKETLHFVKPSSGPFEPVDLGAVARAAVETFRESVQRREIEFELTLPPEPVIATVDPDVVRGVLSNLIKNALEALGYGGCIGVRLRRDGGLVTLEVGDTGPGIPDELRGLIFEPFFTNKDDGTGIGLAITQQNVRSLGGTIELAEDDRYRTLFEVRFPSAPGETGGVAADRAAGLLAPAEEKEDPA